MSSFSLVWFSRLTFNQLVVETTTKSLPTVNELSFVDKGRYKCALVLFHSFFIYAYEATIGFREFNERKLSQVVDKCIQNVPFKVARIRGTTHIV